MDVVQPRTRRRVANRSGPRFARTSRSALFHPGATVSVQPIPWNIYTMLFQGFDSITYFPYIRPNGFGCSIFLASPFLCLLFRQGGRYKVPAWLVIALLTLVLWCHGNPGSWQFSYRYAMILLPWMFLLLTGNGPAKITISEVFLFAVSVAINALAMWQFLWTDEIQP